MENYCLTCHRCESGIPVYIKALDLLAAEHSVACARCGYRGTYECESVHPDKLPAPDRELREAAARRQQQWQKIAIPAAAMLMTLLGLWAAEA